jgi:hypothetical protein
MSCGATLSLTHNRPSVHVLQQPHEPRKAPAQGAIGLQIEVTQRRCLYRQMIRPNEITAHMTSAPSRIASRENPAYV